jgi:hypothetical protein
MNERPELSARIRAALASPSGRLDHLVKATRLDPASDLKFGDWSGLDLSNADLRGFDFTGADLRATRFDNARIAGAIFEGARYDPAALRKAADFDQSGTGAAAGQRKPNSGQVVEVLAGIGPDRITADLSNIFSQMIWTVIADTEKRTGRRDKQLLTAANSPAFELLMALWQRTVFEGKSEPIRPMLLAHQIENALINRLSEKRTQQVIVDTLKLVSSNVSLFDVQHSLMLSSLMKGRSSIKKSLIDAAKALQRLELVEMRAGLRGGRQSVISEILLSRKGTKFVILLLEHAVGTSADRLPPATE